MSRKRTQSVDAVVAGYLGLDLAPAFLPSPSQTALKDTLRPGRLIETSALGLSPGGAVANTGLAMKQFGAHVVLMGRIGRDALGDMIVARLAARSVSCRLRRSQNAGTAYGIVLAPPGTDRIFLEYPGSNREFTARDLDYRVIARARVFHFGYPPLMDRMWANDGASLHRLLKRVKAVGAVTSLDMALPDSSQPAGRADWRKLLERVLPAVDIFVPSLEELFFMLEPAAYSRLLSRSRGRDLAKAIPAATVERLADWVLARGVPVVFIKAGSRGAYVRTGEVEALYTSRLRLTRRERGGAGFWTPPLPVDHRRFRNACGAGDSAVAGLLTALLHGSTIAEASCHAMRAGRDSLYGDDACSGLVSWSRMTAKGTCGKRHSRT